MVGLYRSFLLLREEHIAACIAFLRANWQALAQQGKPLSVSVSEKGAKRTVDQNARLHALLREIASQAWVNGRQYDAETWKEFARRKWIGTEEIVMPDGSRTERGISTTTLGVEDFNKLMANIELYAAEELGIAIV